VGSKIFKGMENSNRSFLGTGWSFPPTFSLNPAKVVMLSNEADVHSSLEVLLLTGVGERIMQPEYGCNLDKLLFEPLTVALQAEIKDMVFSAIYLFEPRVRPLEVLLTAGEMEGKVYLEVQYIIKATNSRFNIVYPFYRNGSTGL
jgi:phage baseplate assembly protein W